MPRITLFFSNEEMRRIIKKMDEENYPSIYSFLKAIILQYIKNK